MNNVSDNYAFDMINIDNIWHATRRGVQWKLDDPLKTFSGFISDNHQEHKEVNDCLIKAGVFADYDTVADSCIDDNFFKYYIIEDSQSLSGTKIYRQQLFITNRGEAFLIQLFEMLSYSKKVN